MESPEYFQANLHRLMAAKGLSMKLLALKSKVSYHTIFRAVSKGVIPRGINQRKLALALGVTVSDLNADPSKSIPPVFLSSPIDPSLSELQRMVLHPERLDTLQLAGLLATRFSSAPEEMRALCLRALFDQPEVVRPYLDRFANVLPKPSRKTNSK